MESGAPNSFQQLLTRSFAELGVTGSIVRTVLLKNRYFAGQKFRCNGVQAVLPAGGSEIAFYDAGGKLIKTVPYNGGDGKPDA